MRRAIVMVLLAVLTGFATISCRPVNEYMLSAVLYHTVNNYYSGISIIEQCIISRESGGNSQVMNSSGHYGLYQFSASTWSAYGGNPGHFGNASVAEQNQVFNSAIAA